MSLTDLELCNAIPEMKTRMIMFMGSKDGSCELECAGLAVGSKDLIYDLMVKYKVEIDYGDSYCCIIDETSFVGGEMHFATSIFSGDSELPRAILECIVESKSK